MPTACPFLPYDDVVNVIVIGAGIVGAAVAEELAARAARVTVLDMRSPGRGASHASAGLLAPYTEGQGAAPLLALCVRSLDLYDDFVARIRDRSGLPVQYERGGTLEVALAAGEVAGLRDTERWLNDQRIEAQWLEGEQLARFEPAVATTAVGGLHIPAQGFVAAGALVKALVHAARLQGAQFESPVEAVRIESTPGHVEVRADERRLVADAVVVAAGTWSGRIHIVGVPPLPVRPIRGQLLQLTWTGADLPKRPVWGSRCYTVPWQPNTLLVGATVEDVGFDERSTVAGVHAMLDGVAELLPGARYGEIAEVRVGLRPATPDGLPLLGPLSDAPGVYVAAGHYRNGVLLAPLSAKLIAQSVLDGR